MVAVTAALHPVTDYGAWIDDLSRVRPGIDFSPLRQACVQAERFYGAACRPSGDTYLGHALEVAAILSVLHSDVLTLAAAILHDVPEFAKDIHLAKELGPEVARLVEGVRRIDAIMRRRGDQDRAADHEGLRKLLLSIDDDIRAFLIKLAERTHDLRNIQQFPEAERQRIATETMDLYAPLANRLGMGRIKWELEDLSFRYLEPEIYARIATLLDERRLDRESYLQRVMTILRERLAAVGLHAVVSGRAKHIYSIWRKMRRKDVDFEHIYDMRAVRVLVHAKNDCYTALGVVHSLWLPISGEFDDYIAKPKSNLYQSLHTAVVGPEDKTLEVQIRTHDMHRHAELGVAAHWRYKEGSNRGDSAYDQRIERLRQMLAAREGSDAGETSEEAINCIHETLENQYIYVFTPKGRVVDLPRGATPLDFAYYIHSSIGHRCRGAKVDGRIVPLSYSLSNGEQVDILTAKQGGPSREWLHPTTNYLHTPRARSAVRQWFKRADPSDEATLPDNAGTRKAPKKEGPTEVVAPDRMSQPHSLPKKRTRPAAGKGKGRAVPTHIRVHGVGNLVTRIARCCQPDPGDPIIGYVTNNQGISIHRADCVNVLHRTAETQDKFLEASWTTDTVDVWPARIQLVARDRPGLLRDVTGVVAGDGINILSLETQTDKKQQIADMHLVIEVQHTDQISSLLHRLEKLAGVITLRRLSGKS